MPELELTKEEKEKAARAKIRLLLDQLEEAFERWFKAEPEHFKD